MEKKKEENLQEQLSPMQSLKNLLEEKGGRIVLDQPVFVDYEFSDGLDGGNLGDEYALYAKEFYIKKDRIFAVTGQVLAESDDYPSVYDENYSLNNSIINKRNLIRKISSTLGENPEISNTPQEKNITGTCKDDLRAVMRGVIGESSDTAKVTCNEEINVFAPDTSHYVVCGFRYAPAKKDYYISAYRGYPYEDDKSVIREISVKDMDTEDVKALLESGALSKAEKQSAAPKETPATVFEEYKGYGYSARTYENARKADLTLAFAVDFTTAGEKCTVNAAGDRHIPVDLNLPVDDRRKEAVAMTILQKCSKLGLDSEHLRLNIAGNGIYTLARNGWTQERADAVVTDVLTALQNHGNIHIDSVRSGGQTGIDEAGIKAGVALDLPTTVLAPKGWAFRTANRQDIFSEVAFKARFSRTPKTRQTASPAPEKNWAPMQNKNEHTQPGRISVVNVKDYNGPDGFEKASKNNVYIGRRPGGNILGNPFTHISDKKTMAQFVVGSRQEAVDRYAEYFDKKYGTDPAFTKAIDNLYNRVKGGEDITLGCWCKPLACHGDIIKEKLEQRIRKEASVQEKPQEEISEKIDASPAPEKNWTPVRRTEDGKWNYRDAAGHILLNTWVDKAFPFKKGLATVINKGNNIQINDKGIVTAIQKINKGIRL